MKEEFVNVKTKIVRQGLQFKTRIEPSSSYSQPIHEYRTNGPILDIDNTRDLRKTIENWEQYLNSDGVIVVFQNQQEIYEYCKNTLRRTVLQFFRNMEQENSSYFQEVKNNISISVFINLIKLYFLGTTQEDVNEPVLYLYKFEQLKLCNLSYIKAYEQKFRKYAILAKIDRIPVNMSILDQKYLELIPELMNQGILKNIFLTSIYQLPKNFPEKLKNIVEHLFKTENFVDISFETIPPLFKTDGSIIPAYHHVYIKHNKEPLIHQQQPE